MEGKHTLYAKEKRWTLSEVVAAVRESGSHHFDRATLKMFNETIHGNYRLNQRDGVIFLLRRGGNAGNAEWKFDPETGGLTRLP
jgi:hypothetical protein